MTDRGESNAEDDYNQVLSIWQSTRMHHYGREIGDYIGGSLFGGSGFDVKSGSGIGGRVDGDRQGSQYKENNNADPNRITDTISLSDMLNTNCSQKNLSSVGHLQVFQKLTNFSHPRTHNQIHTEQEQDDQDLEPVSNRKLQNKVNARRARERRKQEWEEMREVIRELRCQNGLLREDLERRARGRGIVGGKYCNRCQKQIFMQQFQSSSTTQPTYPNSKPQPHQKYLHLYKQLPAQSKPKPKQNQKNPQKQPRSQKYKQKQKQKQISKQKYKQKIKITNLTANGFEIKKEGDMGEMEAEFQEIDFGEICRGYGKGDKSGMDQDGVEHQNGNEEEEQEQDMEVEAQRNNRKGERRGRDRRWIGKMWIALSILMLVLGLHINGFEGSQQRSIRVNEKQARRWISDFQDPSSPGFTIKMKTKPPIPFIQSQKLPNPHSNPYSYFQPTQDHPHPHHSHHRPRSKNTSPHQTNRNSQNPQNPWINSISFQSEQNYARALIEEEETQVQIDKDLLFGIHAELEDIGQYI